MVPGRIEAPAVDETPLPRELPEAHVLRLAEAKLADVVARTDAAPAFVLAADTVVACGRRILGKARERAVAERHLRLLSGRRHRVWSGIAAARIGEARAPESQRAATRVVMTMVRFKRLDESELQAYLASGEWDGKAGGYAIQGRAEGFVVAINGSHSNVVGLPLAATLDLLCGLGWRREP